jgi:hypothetical protein
MPNAFVSGNVDLSRRHGFGRSQSRVAGPSLEFMSSVRRER